MAQPEGTCSKCGICGVAYDYDARVPLVLHCGHTFCKQCIEQWARQKGHVECFIDKRLDSRDVCQLPRNFALVDSARLDVAAAAMLHGLHISNAVLLAEGDLVLTDRQLGSGASGCVLEGSYNDKTVSVKLHEVSN